MRKLVYVCSPYRGDVDKNTQYAKDCMQFVIKSGAIPIAPHLLYTQVLDDNLESDRELGMGLALGLLEKVDELWVFGKVITQGMSQEILKARYLEIPVVKISEVDLC